MPRLLHPILLMQPICCRAIGGSEQDWWLLVTLPPTSHLSYPPCPLSHVSVSPPPPNRSEYLSKFIPPPSPSVPSVCSSLVERSAGRLLMPWVWESPLPCSKSQTLTAAPASAYIFCCCSPPLLFRSEYLSKFIPPPSPSVPSVCSSLVERSAGRLLMLWVRAACLLRPLGEGGKLQLAKDLGELQMVVGQGLFPLDALGPAHRCVCTCACVWGGRFWGHFGV
jgi:hypothetical protein